MGRDEWGYMLDGMFKNLYFIINDNTKREEKPEPITLAVKHVDDKYQNAYTPYFGQMKHSREFGGYTYEYFEEKDMALDRDNLVPYFTGDGEWYEAVRREYKRSSKDFYTKVPVELLPRLTKLVEENPLTDIDEITAFILNTLSANAEYSLTPGLAPVNEERNIFCLKEEAAIAYTMLRRLF